MVEGCMPAAEYMIRMIVAVKQKLTASFFFRGSYVRGLE